MNPADAVEEKLMAEALRLAARAAEAGEVPVGAVIIHGGQVIARAHNQVEMLHDATAHAEMIAITQAAAALENWRLEGAEIYVTLEPCPMCAGALVNSRVSRIVYGADDPIAGACGSVFNIVNEKRLNHRIPVVKGVLGERCSEILKSFFRSRRQAPKEGKTSEP
ncbi:MAG TPA: tRNA adenosine(34) deaminase TadA [Planctomycetota bacterium]|nr:tRNA adenosine(34) deaminase TadA [Planctomycetota bacterium]